MTTEVVLSLVEKDSRTGVPLHFVVLSAGPGLKTIFFENTRL
ncbi:MAG: hypothetical protein ACI9EF_002388 [Pseudohongiellaceae bacterium]|jgi:hypothetical protein